MKQLSVFILWIACCLPGPGLLAEAPPVNHVQTLGASLEKVRADLARLEAESQALVISQQVARHAMQYQDQAVTPLYGDVRGLEKKVLAKRKEWLERLYLDYPELRDLESDLKETYQQRADAVIRAQTVRREWTTATNLAEPSPSVRDAATLAGELAQADAAVKELEAACAAKVAALNARRAELSRQNKATEALHAEVEALQKEFVARQQAMSKALIADPAQARMETQRREILQKISELRAQEQSLLNALAEEVKTNQAK